MDDAISPLHFLRALGMVGATVVIQALAQIALTRFLMAVPRPRSTGHLDHLGVAYVIVAVFILTLAVIAEVMLWAVLYYSWGDLGSFTSAVYFSLASFTTLGATELALTPRHRIVGATEAAVGMLMFGWSTASLFDIIQTLRGRRRAD